MEEFIKEYGMVMGKGLCMFNIIGEIEGHEITSSSTKTTKYEHIIPCLCAIEESKDIKGTLFVINSSGGDVACGLAIAEMIAGLSKPTVSLVIGDSHSISVPLAVACDYTFIVPSATMVMHPVRLSGSIIGAKQTFEYFKIIEERILGFIEAHSQAKATRLYELMMNTEMFSKDLGTVLVGREAVKEGLADEVGGIDKAMEKLYEMCN